MIHVMIEYSESRLYIAWVDEDEDLVLWPPKTIKNPEKLMKFDNVQLPGKDWITYRVEIITTSLITWADAKKTLHEKK
jgi:hypothetical protein